MKLAFREYGEGTPLIILHGLFGQSDNWNTLAKKFAAAGFHAYTVDQRNHGLSPHSGTWDYPSMAGDIHEFINDHHLEGPLLMGHSMGAKTAMYFDQMFPAKSSKLVIADMAARKYAPHHQDVLKALNAVDFNKIETRKEAELILQEHLSDAGTRQFLLKNIYRKDEGPGMGWRFNLDVITSKHENVGVEVPFYVSNTPTLIIRGGKSGYVTEADLGDFERRYPHHRFVTIEGAGHWVHAEKPDEFFEAVFSFITGAAL